MVLLGVSDPSIYYKESSVTSKSARFCLKAVHPSSDKRAEKRADAINVQVVKGKTTTFIHLDEDEAKKVQSHGDLVLKKLQRIHKSVVWNVLVGRSFVDKIPKGKEKNDEVNLNRDENCEFDPNNPRTWSDESLDFIKSVLKANEFNFDGYVVLFCVANNERDANEVDYDEMAWELEKCLTYHLNATRSQVIMNEEATMSRRGLDPVSRKTKTPGGRKKAGFCIYLAYQLLDNVPFDQMVGESVNKHVDITLKKKQLLGALTDTRLLPQIDERIRKQIKEVREFMNRDQLDMVLKIKEVRDPQRMDMLVQFMSILSSKDSGNSSLPQFLSFLNTEVDGGGKPNNRRTSGQKNSTISSGSTIPRPSAAGSIRSRKASITSQTVSISSRSTTPDTPNRRLRDHDLMRHSAASRTGTNSLASIPSSGSLSSVPETLRPSNSTNKRLNGKSSLPQRRPASARPTGLKPPGSLKSPSISASNSPRRGSNNYTPPPEGRITREDLRRMNKSYPSPNASGTASPTAKPAAGVKSKASSGLKRPVPAARVSSFSRATIPMS